MNQFGKLRWECSGKKTTINFLDLTLTIDNKGFINSKIYEKPDNLYLYLPAASSHPYSMLKSLIHGMVHRTIRLTTQRNDQAIELQNLVRRLMARGYQQQLLTSIINDTYKRLQSTNNTANALDQTKSQTDICFFHTTFHPDDPKPHEIQQIFQEEMYSPPTMWKRLPDLLNHRKAKLGVKRLLIAYHRSPNLGNLLSPRLIKNEDGPRVSSYID
jgi:hypothetical protein